MIGDREMLSAALIPNDQVALGPFVANRVVRLSGVVVQEVEQSITLAAVKSHQVAGEVLVDVEITATGRSHPCAICPGMGLYLHRR